MYTIRETYAFYKIRPLHRGVSFQYGGGIFVEPTRPVAFDGAQRFSD